jgi:hypothetical protein
LGKLREFLDAIGRHPGWGWAGLLAYAAVATFPHEYVQFVVNEIAIRISHRRLYQSFAAMALFEGALITWILFLGLRGRPQRGKLAAFWVLTLALIWGIWRVFTANNVELVHYPQYFPEGVALFALTLSASESLAWITLLGGLDECFQYWHLSGSKLVPYDFNDVYMDVAGGAAGIVFALAIMRRQSVQTPFFKKPGILAMLSVLLVGVVLRASGRMLLYQDTTDTRAWFALSRVKFPSFWFQVPANGPNKYHTLSPIEGPILILATIALYSILDWRSRDQG